MNRFYALVAVLAVVLGIGVFAMFKNGGGTAPAAAAGAPPQIVDDSFRGYTLGEGTRHGRSRRVPGLKCAVCRDVRRHPDADDRVGCRRRGEGAVAVPRLSAANPQVFALCARTPRNVISRPICWGIRD